METIILDGVDLETSFWESALRLIIAGICGGIIGWDREALGRDAGLRTHIMVALGASGLTLIAVELYAALAARAGGPGGDVVRILSGIVTGVGFLGAGAIIQAGGKVHGLTTAAGLWVVAAIGVAAGVGFYSNAAMLTVLAFLTLTALRALERAVEGGKKSKD